MRVRMKPTCCPDDVSSSGFLGGSWNIVCLFGASFAVLVEEDLFYHSGMNRLMFKFLHKKWLWKLDLCFLFASRAGWCEWYRRASRACSPATARNGRSASSNWTGSSSGMDCTAAVVSKWPAAAHTTAFWRCHCMRWLLTCDSLCNNSFRTESRVRLLRHFCNPWDPSLPTCLDMSA